MAQRTKQASDNIDWNELDANTIIDKMAQTIEYTMQQLSGVSLPHTTSKDNYVEVSSNWVQKFNATSKNFAIKKSGEVWLKFTDLQAKIKGMLKDRHWLKLDSSLYRWVNAYRLSTLLEVILCDFVYNKNNWGADIYEPINNMVELIKRKYHDKGLAINSIIKKVVDSVEIIK